MNPNLGYTQPLFILAFDHRSSFAKKMFGAKNEKELDPSQRQLLKDYKRMIYEGFKAGVERGVSRNQGAILVDEEFGEEVLRDALRRGFSACKSMEKSGQDEFDFEYGADWAKHLEAVKPIFAKVLIRYNPEGDKELNVRQRARLKTLSDYAHAHGYKFLIEPLIPATSAQLEKVKGDERQYDLEIRPRLMIEMIKELQNEGIEPDVWKIEGLENPRHYQDLVAQARAEGRDNVSCVVLGRGADPKQVETWLQAAKDIPGMIGFAIGRTIFWAPLTDYKDQKISREQAIAAIGDNYLHYYKVFNQV